MPGSLSQDQRNSIVLILTDIIHLIDKARNGVLKERAEFGQVAEAGEFYDYFSRPPDTLERDLRHYQNDAIGAGLRVAIKDVGIIIAPYASSSDLRWIAEEVSSRSNHEHASLAIFSRMWDGIVSTDGYRWTT